MQNMANINDVAKLAGVSRGTVSNVINDKKVKESSRIKVEKAIEELGITALNEGLQTHNVKIKRL